MADENVNEEWKKYVPVLEKILFQCYYRVLSFVSIHTGINNIYKAAKYLSENTDKNGKVYWVVKGKIAKWDNLQVFPDITMSVWLFGSELRQKNTVIARVGWWKMYVIESIIYKIAATMGEEKV